MIVDPTTLLLAVVTFVVIGNSVQLARLSRARRRRTLSVAQRTQVRAIAREEDARVQLEAAEASRERWREVSRRYGTEAEYAAWLEQLKLTPGLTLDEHLRSSRACAQ